MYGVRGGTDERQDLAARRGGTRASRSCWAVELSVRRNDTVRTFSRRGNAPASVHSARYPCTGRGCLLLDEPHAGLDARAVASWTACLAEIRAEHTFVLARTRRR